MTQKTATGLYKLTKTATGLYKVTKTATGLYKVTQKTATGLYKVTKNSNRSVQSDKKTATGLYKVTKNSNRSVQTDITNSNNQQRGNQFWSNASCGVFHNRLWRDLGPVSWKSTAVKRRQFLQSNCLSTIGTRQTEYHEALPSSANVQLQLTSSFADDGNAS